MISVSPALIWSAAIMTALKPGAAHLVDRRGGRGDRYTGTQRRLACGCLAETGRQHATHDHFLDITSLQTGSLDGRFHRGAAELGSGQRREGALKGADGSALCGDDNDI